MAKSYVRTITRNIQTYNSNSFSDELFKSGDQGVTSNDFPDKLIDCCFNYVEKTKERRKERRKNESMREKK